MRKMLTVLLALGLLMTSLAGVAAQTADSAYASGIGQTATWIDGRGNPAGTLEVTNIEMDWDGYSEYSAPSRGYVYQAVSFTVTNTSTAPITAVPYDFSLVDAYGRNNSRSWITVADDVTTEMFEDDVTLAAGESTEQTLAYEVPLDVSAAAFVWQPEYGTLVVINMADGETADGAMATGPSTPSTWTDDRGRAVATLEVTEIEDDWQDYGDYYAPDRGMIYRAVHFNVTNISSSALILNPYDFTLVDSSGLNSSRAWAEVAEGSTTELLEDEVVLEAEESVETVMIFAQYDDLAPTIFVWQPESGILNMVVMVEDSEGSIDTAATPVVEDGAIDDSATPVAATPAADTENSAGITEVNGEPITILNAIGEDKGEVRVISTLDGWDGYRDSQAPAEGTRFVLVTLEISATSKEPVQISPLDFTIESESGGTYASDLFLNADDADPQITEGGQSIAAGETIEVVIPFVVPSNEGPNQVIWETGTDTVTLSLEP